MEMIPVEDVNQLVWCLNIIWGLLALIPIYFWLKLHGKHERLKADLWDLRAQSAVYLARTLEGVASPNGVTKAILPSVLEGTYLRIVLEGSLQDLQDLGMEEGDAKVIKMYAYQQDMHARITEITERE